jgi:lipoprotein signal peptidase
MKTIAILILAGAFFFRKRTWWSRLGFFSLTFFVLDTFSKFLVQKAIAFDVYWWQFPIFINHGVAFGLGKSFFRVGESGGFDQELITKLAMIFWIVFAFVATYFFLDYFKKISQSKKDEQSQLLIFELSLGLILGGIWANVFDRVLLGGVRDWLPIPFTELLLGVSLYNNLADWFLFIGCLIWIYLLFFKIKT